MFAEIAAFDIFGKQYSVLNYLLPFLPASRFGALVAVTILICVLLKEYIQRKRMNDMVWKIPGCNVNFVLLYLAIAKSLLRCSVKTNILSFQILCGSTKLFEKQKIWRMWLGTRPIVVFFVPETVEIILNSNTVLKKTFMYGFLNYWFKEGLITSNGSKWRYRRKLLTPAFHFRILSDFQPIIDEQSRILVNMLKEKEKTGEAFDVVQPVTLCTLDILCETAMGIKVGAQRKNSEYVSALKSASEQFSDRIMKPWLWSDFLYYLTSDGRNYKRNVETMLNFTTKVISDRKREMLSNLRNKQLMKAEDDEECGKKRRQAFLDLLLNHHLTDGSLSEQDIREEVDTFMFAGHDTTAMGISWALYNIGLYPQVQESIQQELDRIFGDDINRPITTEDLREMKYLECVLKESQRLFPSLPVIGRELEEDIVVNGYTVPKGTTCMLATYMLHRNPDTFPDPERFDPDRFLPENMIGRHPFAYVPFSAGPRNCIGQRFAMLEEKTVVANILRHYKIKSMEMPDRLKLTAEMVLRNDDGIYLTIRRRADEQD